MEDLPKRLASSNAFRIAKRLGSISGGKVLDVATARRGFTDTLMKTLKDYDSFVGIAHALQGLFGSFIVEFGSVN